MDLHQIAQILIAEELDFAELQQAVAAYRKLLTQQNPFISSFEETRVDIELETGRVIGPTWAALCIDDLVRTKRFVKGLYLAVNSLLDKKEGPVVILYAGTGPFATLALPLTTLFRKDQIQIRALEINPISCQCLRRLTVSLEVDGYFESIEQVDASNYNIPQADTIDILLSETMQRGLEKEPQVAIMHQLVPQLRSEIQLIPESIELSIGTLLYPDPSSLQVIHQSFFPVFRLDKDSIIKQQQSGHALEFPPQQYKLTASQLVHSKNLVLLTHISVFGREKLTPGESGITLPVKLPGLQQLGKKEVIIELAYAVGNNPGMRFREII
ncbi:MAG: hypothetical protein HRU41_29895 [Saprospiraceae bacterium]|nr:hypothetical protein [Saprospiraceae bacterium]